MKKAPLLLHILYYFLVPVSLAVLFLVTSLLLRLAVPAGNLGAAMAATYAFLFLGVPVLAAALMRLSFLRCFVDPIAAAEIPLVLLALMLFSNLRRMGDLSSAFGHTWDSLLSNGGEGSLFLFGLFLFGLVCSFSQARKRGESLAFRLLARFSHRSL